MRTVKFLAVIGTFSLATALIYLLAFLPYQQNVMKKNIESRLDVLEAQSGAPASRFSAVSAIRNNIASVRSALRTSPTDVDLYMELAAQYRFLGRYDDAAETYEKALRYHRRPELYRNLAECRLAAGSLQAAAESYGYAVAFSPAELNHVPLGLIPDVNSAADRLRDRLSRRSGPQL